jgi:hypothetical protein
MDVAPLSSENDRAQDVDDDLGLWVKKPLASTVTAI